MIEKGWTQGALARDELGAEVWPRHPAASCWCLLGAIRRVALGDTEAEEARQMVFDQLGSVAIATWNDTPGRTQAEVLAVLDRCR